MCPPWLGCCVRLAELVSCLPICLPPAFVFHLGWGAVSASLGLSAVLSPNLFLSPNLSPIWLCLSAWLGCCVRLIGLVSQFASQFVIWLCLPVLSPHLFPIWLCLSPWLGCCVRLAGLVSQFVFHLALSPSFVSPFVSHLALSFILAGVPCPPRWACLRSCLPICLPSGFVSQFFPKQFTVGALNAVLSVSALAGMPCPRLWSRLPLVSGLVSQLVSHLGWGAASASLVSSFSCLRSCLPTCLRSRVLCLPP